MTTDDQLPPWHDLIHPTPPGTPASSVSPSVTATRPRTTITPRLDLSRRSDRQCPSRRLTGHTIGNGVVAGIYTAFTLFLIWLAAEAAPHDTGLAATMAAMAAWCILGAVTHTVTAAIAIRSRHHKPTTAWATTGTRLTRLHLSAAFATVLATAIYRPLAVPAALTSVFAVSYSRLLLAETRDTITRHRQHTHDTRCQPTDSSSTRRYRPERHQRQRRRP
ncbi:hypothetical protein [Actinoplanes sp. GCM10030250]|uniref:hypothetical protein n=1 Tax=Actinoplanes sp. GCM10030250 TaxID=3273376 RepID=UPI00361C0786